jgi:hypothetical protein
VFIHYNGEQAIKKVNHWIDVITSIHSEQAPVSHGLTLSFFMGFGFFIFFIIVLGFLSFYHAPFSTRLGR